MQTLAVGEARLWTRAQQYIAAQQFGAARVAIETLIQRAPQHVMARVLLAGIDVSEGHVRAAAAQLLSVAEVPAAAPDEACKVALALLRVGEVVAARSCADRVAAALGTPAASLAALSQVYQTIGEHTKALALIERARLQGQANPDLSYSRSVQLMFNGRNSEAEAELEACLRMRPDFGRAMLTQARLRKQTSRSNHLPQLRARLLDVERGSVDHAALEFALFKELDDLSETKAAWSALERGNAIMHARLGHVSARERATFDALIELCTPKFLTPTGCASAGPMPIFIVGLPRSGTTLLERILGNHSLVTPAGELDDFANQLRWEADCHGTALLDPALLARATGLDYANLGRRYLAQTRWRAPGQRFFVDKLPANHQLAGFIHRALPQAPILNIVREPMDVCFSNFKALFGDAMAFSYSLSTLAAHHQQYQRLAAHWRAVMPGRILEVPYAQLVTAPEATIRRVLDHCGLPFEAGCEDLSRNRAPVATLSNVQVREAIHARALDDWRRYAEHLAPLQTALNA